MFQAAEEAGWSPVGRKQGLNARRAEEKSCTEIVVTSLDSWTQFLDVFRLLRGILASELLI